MLKLFLTIKLQSKVSSVLLTLSPLHYPIKTLNTDSQQEFILNEVDGAPLTTPFEDRGPSSSEYIEQFDQSSSVKTCTIGTSHPWPEWVGLMEHFCKVGCFEEVRIPFHKGELDPKNVNRIRTACLKFARDRVDLIRLQKILHVAFGLPGDSSDAMKEIYHKLVFELQFGYWITRWTLLESFPNNLSFKTIGGLIWYFSSKDIQVLAGSGCPVVDRKVVNSGKRLRAHAGIDEAHVCGSCSLRGNCERAYVKAREGEGGRTVDVMRLLLTYGLDLVTDLVENKSCLNKMVEETARRMLTTIVERSVKELNFESPIATFTKWNSSVQESSFYQGQGHINVSMTQHDWTCSKCNLMNFAQNTKCLHCDCQFLERLRIVENQDRLALKKGDWICDKCNFLNFGKNSRCLKCNEKPPKRQLNRGEWECDSCNYINFRRNMACIKCDHRRRKSVVLGRQ